jgi:hypothetical protein
MEHGWCPTNYPGRTPIRIAGRFAVLLDFPGILMLEQPPECYGTWFWSDQLTWSDAHPDGRAFVVFRDYPGSWSRLLRKAVRVRAFCAWSLTRFARLGFGKIEKTKRKKLVALVEGMVSVE